MTQGEQLFTQETFENEGHPLLFTEEMMAMLALHQTVALS